MGRKTAWISALGMLALSLSGCVIVADRSSSGSGTSESGSSSTGSGSGACAAPGDHLTSFGATNDVATIGIAADASGVYWTSDDGSVWRADPGGGSPKVIAKGLNEAWTVALDDTSVYVVDYNHGLFMVDKAGGTLKSLAEGSVSAVAVGPGGVYFATIEGVFAAAKDGSAPTKLAAIEDAWSIAADADNVYVKTSGSAGDPTEHIERVPVKGGAPVDLVPADSLLYTYFAEDLAVDGSSVYWLNSSQGTLMKVAKTGGTPIPIASGLADPESLTVSDGEVYFTVRGKDNGPLEDRAVAKVAVTGGAITYLSHGANTSAYGIAVDATNAYWTQKFTGGAVSTACR